ncbi:MAG: hypothetical protein ACHQWU_14135 [Gemmatimonadales bacterium]
MPRRSSPRIAAATPARVGALLPDKPRIVLADAQFVLAREYGFESWQALEKHIAASMHDQRPPLERFTSAVHRCHAPALRRVLQQYAEVPAAISEPIFEFSAPVLNTAGDDPDVVNVLPEFDADSNRKSDWWAGGFHPLYGASAEVAVRLVAAGQTPLPRRGTGPHEPST